jgi:hypothetical protein
MNINAYLRFVLGEHPSRVARLHHSSIIRLKAFAIAIHIPIALWAVTGFIIASQTFHLDDVRAGAVALFCAVLIYMVECLVLSSPKGMAINVLRLFIGLLMAILGASAVDLVIFEREVAQQLRESGESRIKSDYDSSIAKQIEATAQAKADWVKTQDAANCEANGTCGSKIRSLGPVYQQLSRQAEILRKEYLSEAAKIDALKIEKNQMVANFRASSTAIEQAGLLSRIQALHHYNMTNTAALVAWSVFFLLILFFELMVVLVKIMFGETVDDRIERVREAVSAHKAAAYEEAMTSPLNRAKQLLGGTYA